ncbi:MAG: TonB-dependent receptor domain-containing protein, partial [Bacteriovoracia bacterium]
KRHNADERDATDITHLTSSSAHRWGAKFQTDFLASYLHGKAEQDGFASDNSNDYSRNDQFILQQKTNYELDESQSLSLRHGFNRHQRKNEGLVSGSEHFNGNLIQQELIHRKEVGPHGFLTGISTEKESAVMENLDRSFDLHSAFFQTAFERDLFRLHAGLRADKHTKYGSFHTGSAGIGYGEFSFQYSRGYKAPSLYQLYGPDSFGAPVGNPELEPETNHYLEASWKKETDSFEAGVALFQNRLSNLFTYSFTEGYINQQRFIAEGVELNGTLKLIEFHLFGSYVLQNFRKEESTVLRRPENAAQFGVSYFPKETLELNLMGRWFSSRKDVGDIKLNSYEVVDAGIRHSWEKDDVSVQVKNILDREYEELYGFSVLPRSVFLNYGHRF